MKQGRYTRYFSTYTLCYARDYKHNHQGARYLQNIFSPASFSLLLKSQFPLRNRLQPLTVNLY